MLVNVEQLVEQNPQRKSVLVPFRPPQIPYNLPRIEEGPLGWKLATHASAMARRHYSLAFGLFKT
jgi:hypothetical protein